MPDSWMQATYATQNRKKPVQTHVPPPSQERKAVHTQKDYVKKKNYGEKKKKNKKEEEEKEAAITVKLTRKCPKHFRNVVFFSVRNHAVRIVKYCSGYP